MHPSQIHVGRIYQVWMSRKRKRVLIRSKNPSGLYDGVLWPKGKVHVTVSSEAVSQELMALPAHGVLDTRSLDFKSRAAGERDD